MQETRDKLAKNIISLAAHGNTRQDETNLFRAADADIYCPHCLRVIVRQGFAANEQYTCPSCSTQSRFIVWSKTKDQKNWHAGLCPIN